MPSFPTRLRPSEPQPLFSVGRADAIQWQFSLYASLQVSDPPGRSPGRAEGKRQKILFQEMQQPGEGSPRFEECHDRTSRTPQDQAHRTAEAIEQTAGKSLERNEEEKPRPQG